MTGTHWLTIREAARRAGCSARQMRRRMGQLNKLAGGRLLRSASNTTNVRKWWINGQVLDELLLVQRAEREGVKDIREELDRLKVDVDESHGRIDVLDNRTQGHTRRLSQQGAQIKKVTVTAQKNTRALEALKEAVAALSRATEVLAATE